MELNESTRELLDGLVEMVSAWGLQVVGAVAVLIIGRIVANALRRGTRASLTRAGTDETLIPFLSGLVYYVALAVVLIAVLGLFGIETTSLVAMLGAAGLAVGLALQGTLSNFASGVMLLLFRPFRKGDFVDVAGVRARLERSSSSPLCSTRRTTSASSCTTRRSTARPSRTTRPTTRGATIS